MRAINQTRDGDVIPRAHCAKHVHVWLTFDRSDHPRGGWECWCPDCCDGEPNEDGMMVALHSIGCGESPVAALEDYADLEDADPRELDCSGEEQHV